MKSHNPLMLTLLGLPALLYGAAVRIRNRAYSRPGATRRADVPVLSVGNLTVGGTGKTTMVAWLLRKLEDRGHRPAVVSRGYLGRAGRGPVIVCAGNGPEVEPDLCGDEPYLMARDHPHAIVVVGSDRWAGAVEARRAGADVVILDDGFQHLRLERDLDLVLLDAHSPFGNYRLLPAGSLREPASGLARADVILITRSRPGESFVVVERVVRRYNRSAPILRAGHRRRGFVDALGRPASAPRRAVVFCGIGNPDAFVTDLESEGVHLAVFRPFRDHHAYTLEDWQGLCRLAGSESASLLTTEKDMVRLPEAARRDDAPPILALRIEATVHDEARLMATVDAALESAS